MKQAWTIERMLDVPVLEAQQQIDLTWKMHNGIDFEAAQQKIAEAKIELKNEGELIPKSWSIDEVAYRETSSPEAVEAHDELLLANTRLIKTRVNRYLRRQKGHYEEDDVFSWMLAEASSCLWTYDPSSDYNVATHIIHNIRWREQRNESPNFTMVRIPDGIYNAILRLRRYEADNDIKLSANLSAKERKRVYEKTGVSPHEQRTAKTVESRFWHNQSIDGDSRKRDYFDYDGQPVRRKTTADIANEIEDTNVQSQFEEELDSIVYNEVIDAALCTLNERTKEMIELRMGFVDGETYTLEQIAQVYNITRERVRTLINRGLDQLSNNSQILGLDPKNYNSRPSKPSSKSPEYLMQLHMKSLIDGTYRAPTTVIDLKTGEKILEDRKEAISIAYEALKSVAPRHYAWGDFIQAQSRNRERIPSWALLAAGEVYGYSHSGSPLAHQSEVTTTLPPDVKNQEVADNVLRVAKHLLAVCEAEVDPELLWFEKRKAERSIALREIKREKQLLNNDK